MTPTRAASVRLCLATLVAALLAASLQAQAHAGSGEWTADLAPVGTCASAEDATAAVLVKRRAIACLVNWARRHHRRRSLAPSRPLTEAARLKGLRVASCGQLTHTPCGSDPYAEVRSTGVRFAAFGENLWGGPWGVSARTVVMGWLGSPPHRKNLLRRGFRLLGMDLVRAPGLLGNSDGAVWVATFGSRH